MPVLGKLFQSKSRLKENTELLVIVTPELVAPVEAGQPIPAMKYPESPSWPASMPENPNKPAQGAPVRVAIPVETLMKSLAPDPPVTATPPPGAVPATPPR